MRLQNLITVSAASAAVGLASSASAGDWEAYRSGLVNAGGWFYEGFAFSNGSMSGGTLTQTVTTNADQRAVWYSFGYDSGDVVQALGDAPATVGNLGLTSLSASVTVTGSLLQRVTGVANGEWSEADPYPSQVLTSSTSGVSMAWYVEALVGGQYTIWLSNAANRLDLNAIRNLGAANFSVALNAVNFEAFPAWPQGSLSFADTLANARSFGLLITSNSAAGSDFDGTPLEQWINTTPGTGWNPYAVQRNGSYGAFSEGTTSITIGNAIPAPGAIALLGTAGLLGSRRRRS
ncbi:MAG: hypothetical protein FGM39_07885 [Phycisphaerales bacterium]|nr:hypothetical protein [Phycisphaerales bacterium]